MGERSRKTLVVDNQTKQLSALSSADKRWSQFVDKQKFTKN